ncbi:MAG: M20/M25/M40 family metallo-hydrolase [Peptostreptococcaceae bacterium]|nr:M20/M25/M40 family metallo-hydrolase [Peptostreptococcaceae bacterium]
MVKNLFKSKVFLMTLIMVFILGGCGTGGKTDAPVKETPGAVIAGSLAEGYLTEMSDAGARAAGTDKEVAAGEWIKKTLEDMGYEVTLEPFTYEDENGASHDSNNIIVVKKGNTDKTIIVGAHYDSMTDGEGVDDNASGIAVMLEAAKVLRDAKTPQTLKFIFFGAEEAGLMGSTYHAAQMSPEDISNTLLMINFDSLVAGDNAHVYGDGDANGKYRDRVLAIATEKGLKLVTQPGENPEYPAGTTGDWSDHAPFKEVGIPYVYFESTNWTLGEKDGYTQVDVTLGDNGEIWHTEFDTMEYIEANFPGRIAERLATFAEATETLLQEDLAI